LSNKIMVDPVTGASVAGCEASLYFILAITLPYFKNAPNVILVGSF
jgi:hypothetical protein